MTVKALLFLQMAVAKVVSVAPTQTNTREADCIPIYVMYIHRITYLQENVNTVYKETESKNRIEIGISETKQER